MKFNRREVAKTALWGSASIQAALAQEPAAAITHGPFLGHVSMTEVWIWARTARAASFQVRFGLAANALTETSPAEATQAEQDNAAWLKLGGLMPGTRYYYQVGENGAAFRRCLRQKTIETPRRIRAACLTLAFNSVPARIKR